MMILILMTIMSDSWKTLHLMPLQTLHKANRAPDDKLK